MTMKSTILRQSIAIFLCFVTAGCNRLDNIINDPNLKSYGFAHFDYEKCKIYSRNIVRNWLSGVLIVNNNIYKDIFYASDGKVYYALFQKSLFNRIHPNDRIGTKKIILRPFFGKIINSNLTCSSNKFDGLIFFDDEFLAEFLGN